MSSLLPLLALSARGATVTDLNEAFDSTSTSSFSGDNTRTYTTSTTHSGTWNTGYASDLWATDGSSPDGDSCEPNTNNTGAGQTWGNGQGLDNHLTYQGREYRDITLDMRFAISTNDSDPDACGMVFRYVDASNYYLLFSTRDRAPNTGTGGDRGGFGTRLYRVRNGSATELTASGNAYANQFYDEDDRQWRYPVNHLQVVVSGTSTVSMAVMLDRNNDGDGTDSNEWVTTYNDTSNDRIQTVGRVGLYAYQAQWECNFDDISVKLDDKDTDTDGVPDARDNCVSVSNSAQTDTNKNKIGDACEDTDGDGYAPPTDCDDTKNTIYPGAPEVCDAIDQDCDKNIVEAFPDFDKDNSPDCVDTDDDNDGDPDTSDCDDNNTSFKAGATEACDSIDNDCDKDLVDGFTNTDLDTLPDCVDLDDDGDGAADTNDCKSLDKTVFPGAPETCDAIDQDCDGNIIENFTNTDLDTQPDCIDPDDDNDADPDASDCNDLDKTIYNGATESACDTIDSDCDGSITDGVATDTDLDATPDCTDPDDDNDGSLDGVDCAPLDKARFPNATEICDAIDQDCDSNLVEGFANTDTDAVPDCADADDDDDGSLDGADCQPTNKAVFPGAVEVCDAIDSDCDTDVVDGFPDFDNDKSADCVDTDDDNDTDPDAADCDDNNAAVSTKATEVCDLVDSNCNGSVVDAFTDTDADVTPDCVDPDDDNDTEADGTDCQPLDKAISHLAKEVCNGKDDDCSGTIDDSYAMNAVKWYADGDKDGAGDNSNFVVSCTAPTGFIALDGDCDDGDATVGPTEVESCRPGDDDCDGAADDADPEGSPPDTTEWYRDGDSDGFGDAESTFDACIQPDGYTDLASATDCDDKDANVNPNALEQCENGIDDNCDGNVDETVVLDWYPDEDGDGYGDASATPVSDCAAPSADHVAQGGDCDDNDDAVSPDREEIVGNGIDDDCDPETPDDGAVDTDSGDTDTSSGPDTDTGAAEERPLDSELPDTGVLPTVGDACGCASGGRGAALGAWLAAAVLLRRRRPATR